MRITWDARNAAREAGNLRNAERVTDKVSTTSILNFCFGARIDASIPSTLYISHARGSGVLGSASAETSGRKGGKGMWGLRMLRVQILLAAHARSCDEVPRRDFAHHRPFHADA